MEDVSLRFNHIGVAVYDFDAVIPFYLSQGYRKVCCVYDPEQNVEVCVLSHESAPIIELLAPHDSKSPINNILNKAGATPYHICYNVEDLGTAVKALKDRGFMLVTRPKVSNAFQNRKVCFLINRSVGLVELMEDTKDEDV